MPNPFEKPYQPSPEEVKKAEEMMTEEQKEEIKEREYTFREGYREAQHDILPMVEQKLKEISDLIRKQAYKQEIKKFIPMELSEESKQLLTDKKAEYTLEGRLQPYNKITDEEILKLVKELPKIKSYCACHPRRPITMDIVKELIDNHSELEDICISTYNTATERTFGNIDKFCKDVGIKIKDMDEFMEANDYHFSSINTGALKKVL